MYDNQRSNFLISAKKMAFNGLLAFVALSLSVWIQSAEAQCTHGVPSDVAVISPLKVDQAKRTATITLKNVGASNICQIQVGIASYQKFDENLAHQKLYDYKNDVYLKPGQQVTFTTTVPDCAAQVDAFLGPVITDFSKGDSYSNSKGRALVSSSQTNTEGNKLGGKQLAPPAPQLCTNTPKPTTTPCPPVCDASGPYTQNLVCSANPVSTTISANKSYDPQKLALSYHWSTDCPSGVIANSAAASTSLSVKTFGTNGQAISCKVSLTVTNTAGASASCESSVLGGACSLDCTGAINGSAKVDSCGVCNGDGTSCAPCQTTSIKDTQFAVDVASAKLRKTVASIDRLYESLAKKTKNTKTLASARSQIKKDTVKANALYQSAWTTVYTALPPVVQNCPSTLCVSVSNAGTKSVISNATTSLRALTEAIEKRITKLKGVRIDSKKTKQLVTQARTLEKNSLISLGKIPATASSCK